MWSFIKIEPVVSEEVSFKGFPYITLCKTDEPRGGANFDPRGIISITLVEDH